MGQSLTQCRRCCRGLLCALCVCGTCSDDETQAVVPRADAPPGWVCPPNYYNSTDGCDCDCGVWDPDCDTFVNGIPQQLFNCTLSQGSPRCVNMGGRGVCVDGPAAPASWTLCPRYWYNSTGACDCGCGAPDPECEMPGYPLLGCDDGVLPFNAQCNADGSCPYVTAVPPEGWTCDTARYAAQDGCDCECGLHDPDCDDPDAFLINCPCPDMTCQLGNCVGVCNGHVTGLQPVDAEAVTPLVFPLTVVGTALGTAVITALLTVLITRRCCMPASRYVSILASGCHTRVVSLTCGASVCVSM